MPLRDTLTPFGRKRAQDVGDGGARRPQVFWLGGRRHGPGTTREGQLRKDPLSYDRRRFAKNLAADALQILQHLVRVKAFADQQKNSAALPGLKLSALPHEGVVERRRSVSQPPSAPERGRSQRKRAAIKKNQTN